jgi:hypothetical protein
MPIATSWAEVSEGAQGEECQDASGGDGCGEGQSHGGDEGGGGFTKQTSVMCANAKVESKIPKPLLSLERRCIRTVKTVACRVVRDGDGS